MHPPIKKTKTVIGASELLEIKFALIDGGISSIVGPIRFKMKIKNVYVCI